MFVLVIMAFVMQLDPVRIISVEWIIFLEVRESFKKYVMKYVGFFS